MRQLAVGKTMSKKKKQDIVLANVTFTGIADAGQAIGKTAEGQVVFATGVVPGDIADILVIKKRKGHITGMLRAINHYSADRVEPVCEHFGKCGGCKWQNLSYEAQLRHKTIVVTDALLRIGKVEVGEWQPIIPSEHIFFYRNKMEFAFSSKRWLTREEMNTQTSNEADVLGFHPVGGFDKVIDIHKCWLQEEPSNNLRNTVRDIALAQGLTFYNVREHHGFLRNLMLRITTTGEVMVLISFGEENVEQRTQFLDAVLAQLPEITTLVYCINPKMNDTMFDLEMHTYFGKGFVVEMLGEVRFQIGPKSFFQTNTRQGKALYDTVAEFAELKGDENVYDLYTGIGSIGLYLAQKCGKVVGIEEIPAAIEDAKINAALNQINNTDFYAGDVRAILTPAFAAQHGKPDLLITDPPRAGMHADVVKMLLELAAPRLIYVSCNPATQARDLQLLQEKYTVLKVRPADMFPHTHHIENVALLALKSEWT
jgi:23S rRNA (uracil1939-C5)-methyltransferase